MMQTGLWFKVAAVFFANTPVSLVCLQKKEKDLMLELQKIFDRCLQPLIEALLWRSKASAPP